MLKQCTTHEFNRLAELINFLKVNYFLIWNELMLTDRAIKMENQRQNRNIDTTNAVHQGSWVFGFVCHVRIWSIYISHIYQALQLPLWLLLLLSLSGPLWNPFHIDHWNRSCLCVIFFLFRLIINSMWNWQHRQSFSNAIFCCCSFCCYFFIVFVVFNMILIKYAYIYIYFYSQ